MNGGDGKTLLNNLKDKRGFVTTMIEELHRSRVALGFYLLLIIVSYATYFSNIIIRYSFLYVWSILPALLQISVKHCREVIDRVVSVFLIRVVVFFELLFIYLYINRILGHLVGYLIRSDKDHEKSGKFNIHIEWISFRLGLDWNQVVIHGIEWRNPPGFNKTPWLLRIEEVSVAIDLLSVFKALTADASINIQSICIRDMDIHTERYTPSVDTSPDERLHVKNGALNFTVATGVVEVVKDRSMIEQIGAYLKNDTFKFMEAFKNAALDPVSSAKSAAGQVGKSFHDLLHKSCGLDPQMLLTAMTNAYKGEKAVKALFLKYDKDKSGFLDKAELKELSNSIGTKVTDEELRLIFSLLDTSGDGKITYEEFWMWWENKDKRGKDMEKALSSQDDNSKAHDYYKNKNKSALLGIPYKFEIDNLQISHFGEANVLYKS